MPYADLTFQVQPGLRFVPNDFVNLFGTPPTTTSTTTTLNIISSGLILDLDASNAASYSGTGNTWTDLSTNANNATLFNSPTYSSSNGGYFVTNGTQYTTFTKTLSASGSSRTISVWFNTSTTNRTGLVGTRDNSSIGGWVLTLNRTTPGNLSYYNLGGGLIEKAGGISINTWYMATATYNYSTQVAELFINGISIGSQSSVSADGSTSFNGTLFGEQENDSAEKYTGKYGAINIYNRILSGAEILQNFNSTKTRFGL